MYLLDSMSDYLFITIWFLLLHEMILNPLYCSIYRSQIVDRLRTVQIRRELGRIVDKIRDKVDQLTELRTSLYELTSSVDSIASLCEQSSTSSSSGNGRPAPGMGVDASGDVRAGLGLGLKPSTEEL